MRTPLKKTEYLSQLESVLKKYGYTEMYCTCLFGGFNGNKTGGLLFTINAERNDEACREINEIVDPTWLKDEYDWRDMSGVSICKLSEEALKRKGNPVYTGGEFYAVEG